MILTDYLNEKLLQQLFLVLDLRRRAHAFFFQQQSSDGKNSRWQFEEM